MVCDCILGLVLLLLLLLLAICRLFLWHYGMCGACYIVPVSAFSVVFVRHVTQRLSLQLRWSGLEYSHVVYSYGSRTCDIVPVAAFSSISICHVTQRLRLQLRWAALNTIRSECMFGLHKSLRQGHGFHGTSLGRNMNNTSCSLHYCVEFVTCQVVYI